LLLVGLCTNPYKVGSSSKILPNSSFIVTTTSKVSPRVSYEGVYNSDYAGLIAPGNISNSSEKPSTVFTLTTTEYLSAVYTKY